MANWCPKTERGFLYSITQTAHYLGPASGNIFSGMVSESPGGWPNVFYSIGKTLTVILCLIRQYTSVKTHLNYAVMQFAYEYRHCFILVTYA